MLVSYQQFVREEYGGSADKVDALLRVHPSEGLQPGYVPVNDYLGSRAGEDVVKIVMHLIDQIKAHKLLLHTPIKLPAAEIIPTQYNIYLPDVLSIIKQGNIHSKKPITVLAYQGKWYCINGHHRLAAWRMSGQGSIAAQVVTYPLST